MNNNEETNEFVKCMEGKSPEAWDILFKALVQLEKERIKQQDSMTDIQFLRYIIEATCTDMWEGNGLPDRALEKLYKLFPNEREFIDKKRAKPYDDLVEDDGTF